VFNKGGRLKFWTRFLVCKSVNIGLWQATLGLYESNVEDIALSIGDGEDKVVATELIGRERWVQIIMEQDPGTPEWWTSLVLRFERRELNCLRQMERDFQGDDDEVGVEAEDLSSYCLVQLGCLSEDSLVILVTLMKLCNNYLYLQVSNGHVYKPMRKI
jgi:hypothetical protein